LPEVGVGDLKIRPRGDNRCESAKCRGDSFYTQVAVSNQKVYIGQETQQQRLRMNKNYISSNGKVELVGRAEAREPSPELNIAAPMSTDPFPFLQLPREIRDLIYYYALTRSESSLTMSPENIYCYSKSDVWPNENPAPVWGRGRPTCLFRVNRQFSAEASEILYSKIPFHFERSIDASFNSFPLPDNMLFRNRGLVKSIGFTITVSTKESTSTHPQRGKGSTGFTNCPQMVA